LKLLLDHFAVGYRHRPSHGPAKLDDCACPITLRNHDLVWIVDEMLVGKRFEKRKRLLLMSFYSMRRRLVGPSYDAILRVALVEGSKLLRIPRVIQRLHQVQVLFWGHDPLLSLSVLTQMSIHAMLG
jgi:hypothetical protein